MRERIYHLPAKINLCLCVVSDLHGRKGTEVLKSLSHHKPDLITVPGDIVFGKNHVLQECNKLDISVLNYQKRVIPFLAACASIAPTYVSIGNHEAHLTEDDLELVRSTGVTLLDNSFKTISLKNGSRLVIGGLTAGFAMACRSFKEEYLLHNKQTERYILYNPQERPKCYEVDADWLDAFEQQDAYKILLSHHPEYWSLREPYLSEHQIDLVLSGHAHGGQIRVFNTGLFAPGQGWFAKYVRGVYKGPYGRMVVSAGIANTAKAIPRLFNPTEVVYVKLRQTHRR